MPDNDTWPADDIDDARTANFDGRLYRQLTKTIGQLPHEAHDESQPDLYGQAYKLLFDATFQALLDGDTHLAGDLFPSVFDVARQAPARLGADLARETPENQFIFGSEPLMDLMEISGYALFMQELNHDGIWSQVSSLWDKLLAGQARTVAVMLIDTLYRRSRFPALTQGAIDRTERHMKLDRLLQERDIRGQSHFYSPVPQREVPTDQSAIVTVFAPEDFGMPMDDLEDLFVVEYLIRHPEVGDLQLPNKADSLRDSIDRERRRQSGADEGSDDDDDGAPA